MHLATVILSSKEEAEALSIELEDVVSTGWFHNKEADTWTLEVLFEEYHHDLVKKTLNSPLIEKVPEKDWLTENRKSFSPMEIGNFYVYGSHIETPIPDGKIPLKVDAATAFGSGSHGTTSGCLLALESIKDRNPFSVLDIGTGTGILGMGAAKLWPQSNVVTCDIDPESVSMTLHNISENNLDNMTVFESDGLAHPRILSAQPYQVVIANILPNPLKALAPEILKVLDENGFVILSGILHEQAESVIDTYEALGVSLYNKIPKGEWVSLILKS